MKRGLRLVIIFTVMATVLCGCSLGNTSELLSLPDHSPEHAALLSAVESQTRQGWEFAAPLNGENRSTMQSVDFYSDGIPETVVFLRKPNEMRLRMAVYAKTGSQGYRLAFSVDCSGNQFDMADFADLNGDGNTEIVVGLRSGSSALMSISVYTVENDTVRSVFDTSYTAAALSDMTRNGIKELLVVNYADRAFARLYSFGRADCSAALLGEAPLSPNMSKPGELILGMFNERTAGAVVEGSYVEHGSTVYISDYLAYTENGLENLSYSEFFGYSYTTVRNENVVSCDINFDSYLEFPIVTPEPNGGTAGKYISWYRYDSRGDLSFLCASYGSTADSWYFLYPESWRGRVYTRHSADGDGGELTEFVYDHQGSSCVLLSVYLYPHLTDAEVASGGGTRTFITDKAGNLVYALIGAPSLQIPSEMLVRSYGDVKRSLAAVNSYGEAFLAAR